MQFVGKIANELSVGREGSWKKPRLIRWDVVCNDKVGAGGLGVRNLTKLNKALLVNGCGGLCRICRALGKGLLEPNMGRKVSVGNPKRLRVLLGLVFGRRFLKNQSGFAKI